MPPVIDKQSELSLTSEDFDPPLKREKATIPGYWTVEELANELGSTVRKVQYDINGDTKTLLKAYRIGKSFLIADQDALQYLFKLRNKT